MLYMRFSPISPDQREAFTISGPIAKVLFDGDGRCTADIMADRALNIEELSCLSAFVQEQHTPDMIIKTPDGA